MILITTHMPGMKEPDKSSGSARVLCHSMRRWGGLA